MSDSRNVNKTNVVLLYEHQLGKIGKSGKYWWGFGEERNFYSVSGRVGITIPEINLTGSIYFTIHWSCFKKYIIEKFT